MKNNFNYLEDFLIQLYSFAKCDPIYLVFTKHDKDIDHKIKKAFEIIKLLEIRNLRIITVENYKEIFEKIRQSNADIISIMNNITQILPQKHDQIIQHQLSKNDITISMSAVMGNLNYDKKNIYEVSYNLQGKNEIETYEIVNLDTIIINKNIFAQTSIKFFELKIGRFKQVTVTIKDTKKEAKKRQGKLKWYNLKFKELII